MGSRLAAVAAVSTAAAACGPLDAPVSQAGPLERSFAVSNFFTPSGYMGDGEQPGRVSVDVLNERCRPRLPDAAGDCYRFSYQPGDKLWAGVYWVYPANNWGSRSGRRVAGEKFKQVRLLAASETPDLLINFVVGGIRDVFLPYRDLLKAATTLRLGREWQIVRLDISGQEFDRVIGALAWSVPYPEQWDGVKPVVIYLDDIVWDIEPVPEAESPP
jgi:hypothetical protein